MNILIFGNGSLSVAQQERKLAIEMAKKGHKIYLVCNKPNVLFDVGKLPEHKNLNIISINFGEYRFDILEQYIDHSKVDVCFGMDQSVSQFVAEYKDRTKKKAYCMFLDFPVHVVDGKDKLNYNYHYSQRYYYWLSCSLELDGTIFNNSVAIEQYFKRYKREAHLVFYSVSNDNAYEDLSINEPTKDYVFGCNRIIQYKGTDLLAEALRKLDYNYKHCFVSGDPKEIEKIAAIAKSSKNNYTLIEKAGEDQKMSLFYNAKLVAYPQITQWIGGLSIIEGFSVKTPGVCFDYPVLRELYDDCAVYCRPKSIIGLREAIANLYEDEELNKELAEKGYERFKKHFTREVMAENILKVLGS